MLQTRKAFIWECGAEHQGRTDRYIVYPKDILINIDTREKYTSLNIDWDYGDMYLVFDDEMDNEISVELTKEFVDFDEIYAHKVVKENGEELEKGYVEIGRASCRERE